jgi:dipeptidase E
MSQSGFDKLIEEKINDSDFVYAGYSAGSCVVTPTLKGLEIVDDPIEVPKGYNSEIIWEGLGFVDYSIAPHYKSNHPESAMVDETVKYFVEHKMPHKTLSDGEVIIVTLN